MLTYHLWLARCLHHWEINSWKEGRIAHYWWFFPVFQVQEHLIFIVYFIPPGFLSFWLLKPFTLIALNSRWGLEKAAALWSNYNNCWHYIASSPLYFAMHKEGWMGNLGRLDFVSGLVNSLVVIRSHSLHGVEGKEKCHNGKDGDTKWILSKMWIGMEFSTQRCPQMTKWWLQGRSWGSACFLCVSHYHGCHLDYFYDILKTLVISLCLEDLGFRCCISMLALKLLGLPSLNYRKPQGQFLMINPAKFSCAVRDSSAIHQNKDVGDYSTIDHSLLL